MIQELDHRNEAIAKAIQKIQHPAYLLEAEMMGFQGIPQLKESTLELRNSDEVFLGYMEKDRLLGFLSYKKEGDTVDIHRLVVDPAHFREGIGSRLLAFILAQYQGLNFIVSTGKANVPAKNLYKSFDFAEMEDFEVAPGIFCTVFQMDNIQ